MSTQNMASKCSRECTAADSGGVTSAPCPHNGKKSGLQNRLLNQVLSIISRMVDRLIRHCVYVLCLSVTPTRRADTNIALYQKYMTKLVWSNDLCGLLVYAALCRATPIPIISYNNSRASFFHLCGVTHGRAESAHLINATIAHQRVTKGFKRGYRVER